MAQDSADTIANADDNDTAASLESQKMVVVMPPHFPTNVDFRVSTLSDPQTGQPTPYLYSQNEGANICDNNQGSMLLELQALPITKSPELSYGSFLYMTNDSVSFCLDGVVENSNLYTCARIDPLFFLLARHDPTVKRNQWQPWPQIVLADYETETALFLFSKTRVLQQLQYHFYKRLQANSNEDSNSEHFYQFSVDLALKWLLRKQQAVQNVLMQQQQQTKHGNQSTNKTTAMRALSSVNSYKECTLETIVVAGTVTQTPIVNTLLNSNDDWQTRAACEKSLQVVCNYLTPPWQQQLCQHLNQSTDNILSIATKKRKVVAADCLTDNNAAYYTTGKMENLHTKDDGVKGVNSKAKSASAKKLEKVNIKGMKKMNAFFTVAVKKSK